MQFGTFRMEAQVAAALIAFLGAALVFLSRKLLEQRSVNRAVLAEMQRLIEVITRHEAWWSTLIAKKATNHPLLPFSYPVYSSQVKNIGTLTGSVVVRAVRFYGYLEFLNALQCARPQYTAANKADEFDDLYHGALQQFLHAFGTAFEKEFKQLR